MRWTVTYGYVGERDGNRVVKSLLVEADLVDASTSSSMIFFVAREAGQAQAVRAGFPVAGIISIVPEDETSGAAAAPPPAQPPMSVLGDLDEWPRPWPTDDPMALCAS